VDYVLGKWTSEENSALEKHIQSAADCIKSFATIGLERTMNFHNKK
jgi:PTH1 family peptidyl-tRNA hydrolase